MRKSQPVRAARPPIARGRQLWALVCVGALTGACGDSREESGFPFPSDQPARSPETPPGSSGDGTGSGGFIPAPVPPGGSDPIVEPAPPAPGGSGSTGSTPIVGQEDTCDGIDNDGNGIIDDVDVGKDGICDCLKIATLGEPGQWGDGDVFSAWLDERSTEGATHLGSDELTSARLAAFQVIVVQDVSVIGREYSDAEVAALASWIEAGGGLMTLIGYDDPSERANVNRLLSPVGVGYGEQQILQKQGGSTVPVTEWQTHPVSDGISRVGVDNGYPVEGGAASTLIAAEQDHAVGRVVTHGDGRVFAWGDEWITYDSEWTEHTDYQVELFWVNSIKWLTRPDTCQVPVPATIPRGPR